MTHSRGWCRSRLIGGCAEPVGVCSLFSKATGVAPVVMVWQWSGPRAAGFPSQIPAEPLIPFGPSVLGQGMVGKAMVALSSIGGCIPLGTQALKTVLVPTGRHISAQDSLWGRIWPHSKKVFHPPAPARTSESVPGHCTLTPVQLWTLMDYK